MQESEPKLASSAYVCILVFNAGKSHHEARGNRYEKFKSLITKLALRSPMRSNKTMKNIRRYCRLVALLGTLPFLVPCSPGAQKSAGSREYLVYIGTYTRDNSKGIYVCRLDAATGKLS